MVSILQAITGRTCAGGDTQSQGKEGSLYPPLPASTQGLWLSSGLSCLPSTPAALPSRQSCPESDLVRWRGGQRASSLAAFLSPLYSGTTHSWPCFGPSHSLHLGTGRPRSSSLMSHTLSCHSHIQPHTPNPVFLPQWSRVSQSTRQRQQCPEEGYSRLNTSEGQSQGQRALMPPAPRL